MDQPLDTPIDIRDVAKRTGLTSRALRFYEARGFRPVRFTDGADNEEQMPDVRYRWQRVPRSARR